MLKQLFVLPQELLSLLIQPHELLNFALKALSHTVDIIIISYMLYRLLIFVKGTSTFQMIRGLLFLFVVTVVARLLNLIVLNWLLHGFWAISVVLAVIVFQPEIRKALMEMGKARRPRILLRSEMLEELLKAVYDFSTKKIGAIIVVEGEVGLRNYINAGIKIDSDVSWELMETIFMPRSPLHDGAVIIRSGTIAAAASFLPLSKKELPTSVGTRHRAALGITEVSDATAIVVSEETGIVSFAANGELTKDVTTHELKAVLVDYYAKDSLKFRARVKRFFSKKHLKKHLSEKGIAITCGLTVWYYVWQLLKT